MTTVIHFLYICEVSTAIGIASIATTIIRQRCTKIKHTTTTSHTSSTPFATTYRYARETTTITKHKTHTNNNASIPTTQI